MAQEMVVRPRTQRGKVISGPVIDDRLKLAFSHSILTTDYKSLPEDADVDSQSHCWCCLQRRVFRSPALCTGWHSALVAGVGVFGRYCDGDHRSRLQHFA